MKVDRKYKEGVPLDIARMRVWGPMKCINDPMAETRHPLRLPFTTVTESSL